MKKIPLILEQYQCLECNRKWYINTEDKTNNVMACPYGCNSNGNITRKFDMTINSYDEYALGEEQLN